MAAVAAAILVAVLLISAPSSPAVGANRSSKIVFAKEMQSNWDIYVINPDGTDEARLTTEPARDTNPAWSSDGSAIVFQSDRPGGPGIFIMDADGGNQVEWIDSAISGGGEFALSPDGSRVAFVENDGAGRSQILLLHVEDGAAVPVTQGAGNHHSPAWSPDGKRLAFSGERADPLTGVESTYIYTIDATGVNEQRVTAPTNGADFEPAWSPDGSTIAFRRRESTGWHIYTVAANGGAEVRVTTGEGALERDPAWSTDAAFIVFVSDQGGAVNLWMVKPDGSGLTRITDYPGNIDLGQPDWFGGPSVPATGGAPPVARTSPPWLAIFGAVTLLVGMALLFFGMGARSV